MITVDRYVKVILTFIAIELLWLGINGTAPRVVAQAAPTPVVLAGIQLDPREDVLPVALVGTYRQVPGQHMATLESPVVRISGAVTIDTRTPLRVDSNRPLKIEADRPLRVENVPYRPSPNPGD
jgi:hypothetical protein